MSFGKGQSGEVAPAYQAVALHAVSNSMPQPQGECWLLKF